MWDEDKDVRDALLTELADPTPPRVGGGLTEVVRRGRRRRRTQQFAAAAGVLVTAVAGVAFAAGAVGQPNASPPAGSGPTVTTTPTDADWPRADLPAHPPYTTWTGGMSAPAPPEREPVAVPRCSIPDTSSRNVNNVRAAADLQQRVADAVRAVAGDATVGALAEHHLPPPRSDKVDAYTYAADVTDARGTGSVQFSVGTFTGTPAAAADEQAFDEFNCDPPKRQVLADGTLLQIYAMQPSEPFQSLTQVLRIYRPDGSLYTLTVQNFGSSDFVVNPDRPEVPVRVGPGRETLPLSESQLADLGLRVAEG